ncbi:MAG: hypothetical protein MIO93_12910 [ANME-2 cluster archaeon]|nr:hypothetical protein [ANME-2 cluster archaeon]
MDGDGGGPVDTGLWRFIRTQPLGALQSLQCNHKGTISFRHDKRSVLTIMFFCDLA